MRFWRVVAVLGVAGLFYVGHGLGGLGGRASSPLPWEQAAHGMHIDPKFSPWIDGSAPIAVTSSADGQALYFWGSRFKPKVIDPRSEIEIQAIEAMPEEVQAQPPAPGKRTIRPSTPVGPPRTGGPGKGSY